MCVMWKGRGGGERGGEGGGGGTLLYKLCSLCSYVPPQSWGYDVLAVLVQKWVTKFDVLVKI